MQLGIFAYTFVRPTVGEVFDAIKAHGLKNTEWNYTAIGMQEVPDAVDYGLAERIRTAAADRGDHGRLGGRLHQPGRPRSGAARSSDATPVRTDSRRPRAWRRQGCALHGEPGSAQHAGTVWVEPFEPAATRLKAMPLEQALGVVYASTREVFDRAGALG